MTEYTPTTEEVKDTHRRGVSGDRYPTRNGERRNPDAEFDRWLAARDAERDRQVAERAWDEGRRAQIAHVDEWVAAQIPNSVDGGYSPLVNPYRKEATGD